MIKAIKLKFKNPVVQNYFPTRDQSESERGWKEINLYPRNPLLGQFETALPIKQTRYTVFMSLHSIVWWVTGDRAWKLSQLYKFPGVLVDFSIPLCPWSATNLDDSPMRVAWWMHTFSAIISPRTRGRRYHGYGERVHSNSWRWLSMRRRWLLPRLGNSFQPVSTVAIYPSFIASLSSRDVAFTLRRSKIFGQVLSVSKIGNMKWRSTMGRLCYNIVMTVLYWRSFHRLWR